jgi:hemolysin activation/secretion protein
MHLFLWLLTGLLSFSALAEEKISPPAEEKKAVFDIMEYRITGNSVLALGKIEEAVYPFLGEAKNIDDVEKARAALEKTFHDVGYLTVFVNIPEQEVGKGIVTLEIQEGKVERLRVVGSKFHSLGVIKERVPEFAEGKVPYFPAVQAQLASVNTNEDRQVAPVLRAGKTPGTVDVDLKVQDQLPLHGGLELNDRYSANTTRSRLNGSLRYDNLWQLDHSLSLGFQVTPENLDETKVFSATYVVPTRGRDYFAAYGVISKSNVAAVGDINVIGNGTIFGLRYIHPLPVVPGYSHNLTLGADLKDFQETTALQGGDSFNTPISYTPFSVGYNSTLQNSNATTQLGLNATFSLRGVGNDEQEFADKRFLAKSNFAYLRGDLKHTHQLPENWKLFGHVSGQVTSGPLISNEQFAIGGADTVRGYLESSALGDQGVFGVAELHTPALSKYFSGAANELSAKVFFDAGRVTIQDALPAQTEAFNLASYGLGLQLKKWHGISGALDYARVLRTVGQTEKGDSRVHVYLGYDW